MVDSVVPEELQAACRIIAERCGNDPLDTVIVLGSGLGNVAGALLDNAAGIAYEDIPCMPSGHAVGGHLGELRIGRVGRHRIGVFLGRFHLYQGISARDVVFPIRLAAALGAANLVLTNAAGSLESDRASGSVMLISDHINMTGESPLDGRRPIHAGSPFVSLANAYSTRLRTEAHWAAHHVGLDLREGVYVGVRGPHYETPAEVALYHSLGGSAIGMSTVLETIAARALGMKVLGLSFITNQAGVAGNHDDVLRAASEGQKHLAELLQAFLQRDEPPAPEN